MAIELLIAIKGPFDCKQLIIDNPGLGRRFQIDNRVGGATLDRLAREAERPVARQR